MKVNYICLTKYPQNFIGLGKLKNYRVSLHTDPTVKPVNVLPHPLPYHLPGHAQGNGQEDIIEKYS